MITFSAPRVVWIDLLRTVAIVMMVVYHIAFDLWFLHGWDIPVMTGWWKLLQVFTGGLFLALVGVSDALARSRRTPQERRAWMLRRAGVIGSWALLITVITAILVPDAPVLFGILHCIALSVLLLGLAERTSIIPLLCTAVGVIVLQVVTRNMIVPGGVLLPFGIRPPLFATLDYYPLVPWFGVVLLGSVVGQLLSAQGLLQPSPCPPKPWRRWVTWPGRHAFAIYLVHQPVLIIALHLLLR